MAQSSPSLAAAAGGSPLKPDAIFTALADPARRKVLTALSNGAALAATSLQGSTGLRLDATLKHLKALRDAGFLAIAPDQQDKRRMLYSLAPSLSVVRTDTGTAIDFGCCIFLCSGKIQLAGVAKEAPPEGKD